MNKSLDIKLLAALILIPALVNEYGENGIDMVEDELIKRLPSFINRLVNEV